MVHLFHASQVIRIANFAYFHAKFSAKALAQTFGVKSHLAFIHHLRRETLAASARKKSPTLYTPIYFLSVHYLPFRRLNYCPGVMKCEERSTLLEKRACVRAVAQKVLNFSTLLRWIGRFYYSRFQFTHQNYTYVQISRCWKPHTYTTAHRLREKERDLNPAICSEDSHLQRRVLHFGSFTHSNRCADRLSFYGEKLKPSMRHEFDYNIFIPPLHSWILIEAVGYHFNTQKMYRIIKRVKQCIF